MKLLVLLVLLSAGAEAGLIRGAVYPFVHPIKTVKRVFHVATYPVVHPVKTVW
jgi:hypothetical protein